jgi:RecG-like helicase
MRISISKILKKIAKDLEETEPEALTEEDVKRLNKEAFDLLKIVRDSSDKKEKDPLEKLSYDDKILLLAFVVYKRQNICTEPTEDPNVEDAAKILHNKVYIKSENEKSNKKVNEDLEKDLTKQLAKAGLNIKKE